MARSSWKLCFFSKFIWRKILKFFKSKNTKFLKYKKKTLFDRKSSIPSCFKGNFYKIHKGNGERKLFIHKFNVGKKFGEFSFTRKPFHFPLKKKKGSNLIRR